MALTPCSLCTFVCDAYKSLYDANGKTSKVYEVVIKYFRSSLLDDVETAIKVICLECWQHIRDFQNFQQWIFHARTQGDIDFIIKEEEGEDLSEHESDFEIDPSLADDELILMPSDSDDHESFTKEINMFECSNCKELFQSYDALDAHFKLCQNNASSKAELSATIKFFERKIVKVINERDKNAFKCDICEASFSQYGNLRRHVRKQHAAQPLLKWKCRYCHKLFRKQSLLESHKNKMHKDVSSYKTRSSTKQIVNNKENYVKNSRTQRGESFRNYLNVVADKRKQHDIETSCTSKFSIKQEADDEGSALQTVDDPMDAEHNPKTEIHKPALEIIDIKSEVPTDDESNDDDYMDHTNSQEFQSESDEKVDKDFDKQNVALECPRCSQLVRNYTQLEEHFNAKHPDERCYINCCHTTLYERQSVLDHLRFHKNPRTFKCTQCGKCFKGKKGLSSHTLQVHSDNRSAYHLYLCCCKVGAEQQEKNLAKGEQQMKYDRHICCQRKKKILEDDELIAKWRQELSCEICKAKFAYYSQMRSHSYYEHPGQKCYILCCQRKIARISDTLEHVRFHLNPDLYCCQKCNINFSGKSALAKHMRNAHSDSLPKYKWACDECDKTFEIRQILTRHKNVCHSKKSD